MIFFIILAIYLLGLYPSYRIILHSNAQNDAKNFPELLIGKDGIRISPVELAKKYGGHQLNVFSTIFWPIGLPLIILLTNHCCWREPK